MTTAYAFFAAYMLGYLLLLTIALMFLGRRWHWIARPPAIDLVVALLTLIPWIIGWVAAARIAGHWFGGFAGLALTVAAQLATLELFDLVHRRLGPKASLRINATVNKLYGGWRSRLGLWVTVPSIPGFMIVRFWEYAGYYPLVVLLHFKRFRHGDYIAVSRHKIENLVGADLIWCLYCDWMTGQWSLGTEMLNQVETFWCPLAFVDKEKCGKCAQFFDMTQWAPSETDAAGIEKVILTIQEKRAKS